MDRRTAANGERTELDAFPFTQGNELEVVLKTPLDGGLIRSLTGPAHARGKVVIPELLGNRGMSEQRDFAAEYVSGVVGQGLESGAVVGMEMRENDGADVVDVEPDAGG